MRLATLFLPLFLATELCSRFAYAQAPNDTPEDKARILLESGKTAKEAQNLPEALRFFRESHDTYASPSLDALVHIADCENALGQTSSAYLHYKEYLRNAKMPQERSTEVTNILSSMVKAGPWIRIARRDLLDAKTVILVDGVSLGPVPGKVEDIPAAIGPHTVIIREPGKAERSVIVDVQPGKHAVVDFRPTTSSNGAHGQQPVGPETPKPLPHWVLPVGIVFSGAGAVTTLAMGAGFAAGAAKESPIHPQESDRLSTTATGLLIAGGALTTATIVMIVVNHRKQRDVAILPVPLPDGSGAAFIGRF